MKYTVEKFQELSQRQRVDVVALELLKFLQIAGGISTKKESEKYFAENSKVIPAEWINKYFNGKHGPYRRWDFDINFAIKNCSLAGYLTYNRHEIRLTELGKGTNLATLDVERDITSKSDKYWEAKKEENKQQKLREPTTPNSNTVEEDTTENDIDIASDRWKAQIREILLNLTPYDFEFFSRILLKKMGVLSDGKLGVQKSNDGGIDGFGYIMSDDFRTTRVALQAKRYTENKVGSKDIQAFKGAVVNHNAEYGIFITTSTFSSDARKAAVTGGGNPITLIDIDKIIELIEKYQMGLVPVNTFVVDETYYYFKDSTKNENPL